MEALDHQKKKFSINFTKANTKFCLSLHYNADKSYFFVNVFVNGKESLRLNPKIKMLTFQLIFVWEEFLMGLMLLALEKYL